MALSSSKTPILAIKKHLFWLVVCSGMGPWGATPEPAPYFVALGSSKTPILGIQNHLFWLVLCSGMGPLSATPEPTRYFVALCSSKTPILGIQKHLFWLVVFSGMGAWSAPPEPTRYFVASSSSKTPILGIQKHLFWRVVCSSMPGWSATPEPTQYSVALCSSKTQFTVFVQSCMIFHLLIISTHLCKIPSEAEQLQWMHDHVFRTVAELQGGLRDPSSLAFVPLYVTPKSEAPAYAARPPFRPPGLHDPKRQRQLRPHQRRLDQGFMAEQRCEEEKFTCVLMFKYWGLPSQTDRHREGSMLGDRLASTSLWMMR